jgi:hypothetical protein
VHACMALWPRQPTGLARLGPPSPSLFIYFSSSHLGFTQPKTRPPDSPVISRHLLFF